MKVSLDNLTLEVRTLIFKRIGQPLDKEPKLLGQGAFAFVYWLSDRKKVLKLTTDKEDAKACTYFKDHPSKAIAKIYDVFYIEDNLYGIVLEKLMEPSGFEGDLWDELLQYPEPNIASFVQGERFVFNMQWFGYFEYALEDEDSSVKLRRIFKEHPEIVATIKEWCKAFTKANMWWNDLHRGNIMFRRRQPVLMDLGYGRSPSVRIPKLM